MPIREFYLDRILAELELSHDEVSVVSSVVKSYVMCWEHVEFTILFLVYIKNFIWQTGPQEKGKFCWDLSGSNFAKQPVKMNHSLISSSRLQNCTFHKRKQCVK